MDIDVNHYYLICNTLYQNLCIQSQNVLMMLAIFGLLLKSISNPKTGLYSSIFAVHPAAEAFPSFLKKPM